MHPDRQLHPLWMVIALLVFNAGMAKDSAVSTPIQRPFELDFKLSGGLASYEENVSIEPVDSEWSAPLLQVEGRLSRAGPQWYGEITGQLFLTGSDDEVWTGSGLLFQINDMQAWGGQVSVAAGPSLTQAGSRPLVRPMLTAGYRQHFFERRQFRVNGKLSGLDQVEESYHVAYVGGAADFSKAISDRLTLGTRLEADVVLFNEADNSLIPPSIQGKGGWILQFVGEVRWKLSPRTSLSLGTSVDHQELSGDNLDFLEFKEDGRPSFNAVEWPDSLFSRISGDLTLRIGL